jgi:hypothetical protein
MDSCCCLSSASVNYGNSIHCNSTRCVAAEVQDMDALSRVCMLWQAAAVGTAYKVAMHIREPSCHVFEAQLFGPTGHAVSCTLSLMTSVLITCCLVTQSLLPFRIRLIVT